MIRVGIGTHLRPSLRCNADHDSRALSELWSDLSAWQDSHFSSGYRARHHDFPNQTTLDKSFDEAQLEAYRQLGAHVVDGLFVPSVLGHNGAPETTVAGWFKRLASNLLPRQT